MQIKCWGVRGSIPTPATPDFDTRFYGGNTTCYQIISSDFLIIEDAGSGLRLLGSELVAQSGAAPIKGTFFFSHVHWDHIQGFPFFTPAFQPGNEFVFYSPHLKNSLSNIGSIIEEVLRGQQENPTFPVTLAEMPSSMTFNDLPPNRPVVFENDDVILSVLPVPVNHPGGCYGYRFTEERKDGSGTCSCAICTDHEHGTDISPAIQQLAAGVDALIYDAAYTHEEYNGIGTFPRKGWGHSTWEWGVREAIAAGCKRLYLIHHDPLHDDEFVREKIEKPARAEGEKRGIFVEAIHEGQVIDL